MPIICKRSRFTGIYEEIIGVGSSTDQLGSELSIPKMPLSHRLSLQD